MSKRIGAERVEYWRRVPSGFNQPKRFEKVAEWSGCWPQFPTGVASVSGGQGVGGNEGVISSVASFWIPQDVVVYDSEDYLVWARYPDEKYGIDGEATRIYTRRGQLRACVLPVERIASEAS